MRNKIIGIGLGLVVGLIAVFFLTPKAPTNRFWLQPEGAGKLQVVEIQFTKQSATVARLPIRTFLEAIDPQVKVIIVCGNNEDLECARNDCKGLPFESVIINKEITGWSKDRFLVSKDDPKTILIPKTQDNGIKGRMNDSYIGPALVNHYPKRLHLFDTDLFFEAGDILCSGKKVIVSDSLWEKNGRRKTFIKDLKSVFENDIVWLRNVPDHHIGMFAAPTGDRLVFVGDPDLAKPFWNANRDNEYGKADFSAEMTKLFKNVVSQLKLAGYQVIPVPTVPFDQKTYISYTNGVFEQGIVYMPSYDIPELDQMARATYEKHGLKVKPIPVKSLYKLHGTIGCLVNVLERSSL